jgi:hypothetical protein
MRLKSEALRHSFASILPRLTAESRSDIGAVAQELHSHPAVTAAAMLAAARVGSQATWLPHRSFKSFPHHIVLEMPSGEESFQWRASWN